MNALANTLAYYDTATITAVKNVLYDSLLSVAILSVTILKGIVLSATIQSVTILSVAKLSVVAPILLPVKFEIGTFKKVFRPSWDPFQTKLP